MGAQRQMAPGLPLQQPMVKTDTRKGTAPDAEALAEQNPSAFWGWDTTPCSDGLGFASCIPTDVLRPPTPNQVGMIMDKPATLPPPLPRNQTADSLDALCAGERGRLIEQPVSRSGNSASNATPLRARSPSTDMLDSTDGFLRLSKQPVQVDDFTGHGTSSSHAPSRPVSAAAALVMAPPAQSGLDLCSPSDG